MEEILKKVDPLFYQDIVEERSGKSNKCPWFTIIKKVMDIVDIWFVRIRHRTRDKISAFRAITTKYLNLKKEISFVPMSAFEGQCSFLVSNQYNCFVIESRETESVFFNSEGFMSRFFFRFVP